MRKLAFLLVVISTFFAVNMASHAKDKTALPPPTFDSADDVLDQLHHYAAAADWGPYKALFTENANFIGTDVTEYWTLDQLIAYARQSKGWTYSPQQRHIKFSPDKQVAWFHEVLFQEKYGIARGTGTLLLTDSGWKIAQYHLAFPIPNDLTEDISARIKEYRQHNKK